MLRRYRPDLVNALVLLAAWALFFWRFAAPNPADRLTYPQGDFTLQFGVFRDIAYRQLVDGHFPLWTDCLNAGYPFHADPQAQLFYPPIWLVFGFLRMAGWGHFPIGALVAEAVAHYLFVSYGVYWFLRGEVRRPEAALLGALAFTYSGYLTGSPPLQTATLETVAWLPFGLVAARGLVRTNSIRPMVWLVLILSAASFAGHPQTFLYVTILVVAYLLFTARGAGVGWGRVAAWLVSVGVWGGLLVAVQLLPSLTFIRASTRASIPFSATASGFPFQDILGFFVTGVVSYWQPLYVGLLPLAMAAFAVATRRDRRRWFWLAMGLVALLLSFGTRAVVYDSVYWIFPLLQFFRGQEHWAVAVAFSLATLAAFGTDQFLGPHLLAARSPSGQAAESDDGWGDHRTLITLVKIASGIITGGLIILAVLAVGVGMAVLPEEFSRAQDGFGRMVLVASLLAGLLGLRLYHPASLRMLPALALGLVVLDLFSANREPNPVPLFEPFPPNPLLISVLEDPGFFRIQDDYQLQGHAGCGYGFRDIGSITPYRLAMHADFMREAPDSVRWQLLGVKYVFSWPRSLPGPAEVIEKAPGPGGETWLYQLVNAEPNRAFLVHDLRVGSGEALWAGMRADGFDGFQTAWTELPIQAGPATGPESVDVMQDTPGRIALQVHSTSPGLLVVSEAYYPGWRVTLDGERVPAVPVDGMLLGAPLPAGNHTVELVYDPDLLRAGGMISILSLLGTVPVLLSRWELTGARRRTS